MDSLEAAAMRSGKGIKSSADSMSNLGSSSSKAGKDVASTSGAVDGLASSSTSASKNVAGTASNLGDLSNISSSASKNLQGATSAIGDIAGGSTAASSGIKSTTSNFTDLSSISSTAGSNLQNTNLVLGDIAGGSTAASGSIRNASDSLNSMGTSAGTAADATRQVAQETQNVGNESSRASMGIKEIAVSLGLVALASAAFTALKASLDSAISRFDTLIGFPVIMQQMGFSSEQATDSINKLSDGIQGLPTTLDGIVKNAQGIAILTGDLDSATETTLALNNAFLASGSDVANAERGLTQYVQMLSKGSVDMMSWRTLQETMGYALRETAKAFDLASPNDLYAELKEGNITFDAFNGKLIELNGGVGGFAELAKTSSAGIATSFGNLKNTVVVGVANMIISFDKLSNKVTGKGIAENLDGLKVVVKAAFKVMGTAVEATAPIVIDFASAIKSTIPVVQALTPAIVGLIAAYAAYTVITSVTAAIKASNVALAAAQAAQAGLTVVTNAQIASKVAEVAVVEAVNAARAKGIILTQAEKTAIAQRAVVDKAAMMASAAELGLTNARSVATGVLTSQMTISAGVTAILTAATTALGAAVKFLLGPVGLVIAGIGLLVAGVIGLVKWFNRSTEEGEKLAGQTENLAGATNALNTAVDESVKSYEKQQQQIATSAEANAQLAAQIEELAAKENKSGEEKKQLNSYIEELNRNVTGLNLVYGEESNALSMTSEQMTNRISLMEKEQGLHASQERLTEIIKEQIDIGKQQEEVTALREEWRKKLEEETVTSKEHKDALEELEVQEVSLSETNTLAGEERLKVEQQIIESSKAVADAMENDISRQMLMYDELSDSQKEAVDDMKSAWDDYASAATDMFDKLSDKSKVSVKEMQANLEENQRVITAWSENIATLAERGIDEGLLNTLREAGPESAGHVNALVKASDTELQKLSESFSKGGDVATKALSTSLGIKDSGILESVSHLVVGTEKALADSIKSANFEGLGVDIAKGQAGGIIKGTPEAEKAAKEMAKATEDAARNQLKTHSPSKVFEDIGKDSADGLTLGISKGVPAVVGAAKSLAIDILKPFDITPRQFETIGKDMAAGLNQGLNAGKAQVLATAKNIADSAANTMRKALDIHSPSRVFETIGDQIGSGVVVGIKSTMSANEKAMLGVGNVIIGATKNNAKEVAKISTEAEKKRTEIQSDYAKKRAELSSKTALSSQAALKTHKNKKGEIVTTGEAKVYKIRSDASAKLTKLNEEEQKKLATVNEKTWADIQKKESELSKAKLEAVKQFIADKKSLEQLSVVDEVVIWQKAVDSFKAGTKEKITAQIEYGKALEVVNKEITSINKKYASEMQRINDDFEKSEENLTKKYKDTLDGRMKALYSFAGTFDEFDKKTEKSGAELLKNLKSQVDGFKDWQTEIEKLAKRAIDDGLLAELRAMGPKALGELVALNSMSDEKLTQYSALYQEKSALARTQAEAELIGMKEDTAVQIDELRKVANNELSALQSDWQDQIKMISNNTSTELKSLNQIGKDAVKGLINGMESMHADLQATAKGIADSVSGTIKDSLKIKSPSRVMYQVGEWTVGGLVGGMSSMQNAPAKIIDGIAKSITDRTKSFSDSLAGIYNDINHKTEVWGGNYLAIIKGLALDQEQELTKLSEKYRGEDLKNNIAYERGKSAVIKHYGDEQAKYYGYYNKVREGYLKEHAEQITTYEVLMHAESFNALKEHLDKARAANEISALDEMRIWQSATTMFKENSIERKESIEQLKGAHERAIEGIKVKNEELRLQEIALTAEYTKAVDERAKSIMSFANTFDEFKTKQEVSGAGLMSNLQSQVDGFKSWQENIAAFSAKAIDEGLIAELKAMGPKALAELQALNSMTDAELDAYSALYQEKQAIGRAEAEKELVGLKTDTESRIQDLKNAVQAELDMVNSVWKDSSAEIVAETVKELAKLKDVGVNAGQGLLDGLASMEGALVAKAASIAENIKSAMAGALDIHSPSRWMRDFIAGNMALGFIAGVDKNKSKIVGAASRFGELMKPELSDIRIPNVNIRPFNPSFGGGGGGSSSTDNRKTVTNKIENHFTPAESTPSESARKQEQMLRRLAMEF